MCIVRDFGSLRFKYNVFTNPFPSRSRGLRRREDRKAVRVKVMGDSRKQHLLYTTGLLYIWTSKEAAPSVYNRTGVHTNLQKLGSMLKITGSSLMRDLSLRRGNEHRTPLLTKVIWNWYPLAKWKWIFSNEVSLGISTTLQGRPHA